MKQSVRVTVNGRLYEEEIEPRQLLSYFLRETIGLTGTHIGCIVGECGACTVQVDGTLVKSCLMFAVQANGKEITTIEGLADGDTLHPVQGPSQQLRLPVRLCTPGMIWRRTPVEEESDPGQEIREDCGESVHVARIRADRASEGTAGAGRIS